MPSQYARGMEEKTKGPSLVRRGIAVLVLAVAAWLLLKIVIGIIPRWPGSSSP